MLCKYFEPFWTVTHHFQCSSRAVSEHFSTTSQTNSNQTNPGRIVWSRPTRWTELKPNRVWTEFEPSLNRVWTEFEPSLHRVCGAVSEQLRRCNQCDIFSHDFSIVQTALERIGWKLNHPKIGIESRQNWSEIGLSNRSALNNQVGLLLIFLCLCHLLFSAWSFIAAVFWIPGSRSQVRVQVGLVCSNPVRQFALGRMHVKWERRSSRCKWRLLWWSPVTWLFLVASDWFLIGLVELEPSRAEPRFSVESRLKPLQHGVGFKPLLTWIGLNWIESVAKSIRSVSDRFIRFKLAYFRFQFGFNSVLISFQFDFVQLNSV